MVESASVGCEGVVEYLKTQKINLFSQARVWFFTQNINISQNEN
jgi:hypothetical protein